MPCDAVAVVSARLTADIGQEIVGNQAAVDVLLAWLKANIDARAVVNAANERYIQLCVSGRYLTLDKQSNLTIRGIDRVDAEMEPIRAKVQTALQALALELVNQRLDAKIRSLGTVTEDRVMPGGARLITVSV